MQEKCGTLFLPLLLERDHGGQEIGELRIDFDFFGLQLQVPRQPPQLLRFLDVDK
jgi:hypothetical protein